VHRVAGDLVERLLASTAVDPQRGEVGGDVRETPEGVGRDEQRVRLEHGRDRMRAPPARAII
jgi:hypothetical protein